MAEMLLTRYLQPLLAGRRSDCFAMVHEALAAGRPAAELIEHVIWPAMAQVDRLYRDDRINTAHDNIATRINRTVADQLQRALPTSPSNGRRILVTCADEPREELGAQMVADLLQSDGWEVVFVGGGVPHDELVALIGQIRPHALVIFGTQPTSVPAVRQFVMSIREIGICPEMNIIASGGVFNRAEGLWREVGADVFCDGARDILETAATLEPRIPGARPVGLVKKRRRKRKAS